MKKLLGILLSAAMMMQPAIMPAAAANNSNFTENFDKGAVVWTTSAMSVCDGVLESNSNSSSSSASLNGTSECYWKNLTADIRLSIDDFASGWVMVKIRDNEIIMLRTSGMWRFKGREQYLASFALIQGKFYDLHIEAIDENIKVSLKDGSNVLADTSFTTDNLKKGKISFQTSSCRLLVDSVAVYGLDEGELFDKNVISLENGSSTSVTVPSGTTLTSSNESIVTVDSSGKITAVGNGTAQITAVNGSTTDCISVTVYTPPEGVRFVNEVSTLELSDAIGVRIDNITPSGALNSYLTWESSNENVLRVIGKSYTRKSLKAVGIGVAKLTVKNFDGDVLYENTITVLPKKESYTGAAYASFGSEKTAIKPLLFGIHTPSTTELSDTAKNIFSDMGFKYTRSFQINPQTEGVYNLANENNIPQMIGLNVLKKTTDELVKDVEAMRTGQDNNATIYVELGNELYDFQFNFDKDGDGDTDAYDYVALCRPIYTALKQYASDNGFEIKIGAVLVPDEFDSKDTSRLGGWNTIIQNNPDFYDAVIIHHYTTFGNADGRTQDEAMSRMYANNVYFRKVVEKTKEAFPDKDLWCTEYGTFISDCFSQSDNSEKARLQFGNTVGVALTNAEKILDMAADGKVDMSSYHCFSDVQGFGIIGNDKYLPAYYTFKKASELLNDNSYIYPIESVYSQKNNSALYLGGEYDEIGLWGFGDENKIKYALISNRAENPRELSINGYSLKRQWSYSGEDVLEGYMDKKASMYTMPSVPQPIIFSDEPEAKSIILDGYSFTVCELEPDTEVTGAYIGIDNGMFNPLTDTLECCGGDIKMYSGGNEINVSQSGSDIKKVIPENGFEYDTEYTVTVGDTSRTFTTVSKPPFENFNTVFSDDFSSYKLSTSWSYDSNYFKRPLLDQRCYKFNTYPETLKTNKTYSDFVLTFDITPDGDSEYVQLHLRNGFLRFQFKNNEVRSYFNDKNDTIIGYMPTVSTTLKIKVAAYKEFVYVWCDGGDGKYEYVGKVINAAEDAAEIGIGGSGKFYIDNVVISSYDTALLDVDFLAGGERLDTPVPIVGENNVNITLGSNYGSAFCVITTWQNERIKQIELFENNSANLTVDEGDNVRMYIWDGKDTMKPYENVYTPLPRDMIER